MENSETTSGTTPKSTKWRRGGAIATAGLLAGLLAAALGGTASAQTVITETGEPSVVRIVTTRVGQVGDEPVETGADHGDDDFDDFDGLSAEDEAVFEQFEQCLSDAGVDVESDVELDEAALDAAFESCDPILDGLSEGHFGGDFDDLSAEDEAVFEQFEQCLSDAGVDVESDVELDEAALDAAFESCDPILDGLSEGHFGGDFDELSAEDEAVFERFEQCLDEAGIDDLFEAELGEGEPDTAELDDDAIDAVFESCDPILDDLSEDAQELLGVCDDF